MDLQTVESWGILSFSHTASVRWERMPERSGRPKCQVRLCCECLLEELGAS